MAQCGRPVDKNMITQLLNPDSDDSQYSTNKIDDEFRNNGNEK